MNNDSGNSNYNEPSDQPHEEAEEVHDIVHDLNPDIRHSGYGGEAIETSPILEKKRQLSGKNLI